MKVAVIDYGIGNVKSMYNALSYVGLDPIITGDDSTILSADVVVLPGVGAFVQGIANLRTKNLDSVIFEYIKKGRPFIGVCLGMQMLLQESEEFGKTNGLGLIEGSVRRIPIPENSIEKLPHIGWNSIHPPTLGRWVGTPLANVPQESSMYFVHTYAAVPKNSKDILANCSYGGVDFCAAIQKDNIYGFQFHPEKSAELGLTILKNIK